MKAFLIVLFLTSLVSFSSSSQVLLAESRSPSSVDMGFEKREPIPFKANKDKHDESTRISKDKKEQKQRDQRFVRPEDPSPSLNNRSKTYDQLRQEKSGEPTQESIQR